MKHNGVGPVVALDIDGTLGDYHGHFLRFAEGWYGRAMPDPKDINPGLPLHRFMQTGKATYRECKLAYRQGGLERSMPVYPGAADLTKIIRRAGAELWLATTRPYLKLDTQNPNTRHWLKVNHIQYDHLIWGEYKYRDLVKQVGLDRIVVAMDDLPEMLSQATNLGVHTVLRDQPYNKHYNHAWRVSNMNEAEEAIMFFLDKWKESHGG